MSTDQPIQFDRRRWLSTVMTAASMALIPTGCAQLHRRKNREAKQEDSEAACTNAALRIQRRFFVSSQGPLGVNGEAGGFAREIVAAMNTIPGCSAILLPLNFPIDPPPGMPPGPSPQLLRYIEAAGPSPAVDELLVVHVTDVAPFRPMRISAVLERRSIGDGTTLSRDHKTWNAPLDMDPLSPNGFNRFLLNHPPPMGVVENHELNRLSPQTFQRGVAEQVATEIARSPL
ncbi:hypothetical protein SH661x_000554 [Planctomicrobium sp. SH661]|uniref:hypothetical protein n=1 Tax=Planctomicrobium sp. SH661 TaxID=3448124 RepID=UPI003F5B1DD9